MKKQSMSLFRLLFFKSNKKQIESGTKSESERNECEAFGTNMIGTTNYVFEPPIGNSSGTKRVENYAVGFKCLESSMHGSNSVAFERPRTKLTEQQSKDLIPLGEFQKKITKLELVKNHLLNHGSIDSWTAITMYRATRLSGIIYTLKNTHGMSIETIISKDKSHFATYVHCEKNVSGVSGETVYE